MLQRQLEPAWLPRRCVNTRQLHPVFRSHLLDAGSTTLHIASKINYHFTVEVHRHNWGRMQNSEAKALDIAMRNLALVREVDLLCDGKVWMFARVIIPANSLLGDNYCLRKPFNFALGKILFADVNLKRSEFELARLRSGHIEYNKSIVNVIDPPTELWARRSIFLLRGKPLLLIEVFIPHPVLYENQENVIARVSNQGKGFPFRMRRFPAIGKNVSDLN